MKTQQTECQNCGPAQHAFLGFIPERVIEPTAENTWLNVAVCTACGNMRVIPPTADQIKQAEDTYLSFLVDNEIINEDEQEQILGW